MEQRNKVGLFWNYFKLRVCLILSFHIKTRHLNRELYRFLFNAKQIFKAELRVPPCLSDEKSFAKKRQRRAAARRVWRAKRVFPYAVLGNFLHF